MDVMRQDHAFLTQNVRQKNVDDMRRKTSINVRFAVRTFCGVLCYRATQRNAKRTFFSSLMPPYHMPYPEYSTFIVQKIVNKIKSIPGKVCVQ
jgi:hypothetical protein